MDLTLNEALADVDVCAIGRAEDGPDNKKITNIVEKMKNVVQAVVSCDGSRCASCRSNRSYSK